MKILISCLYPLSNPEHGGQLRVRNIVEAYRTAGHDVEVVGVLSSESYEKDRGFLDYPDPEDLKLLGFNTSFIEDYAIGQLILNNQSYYNKFISLIQSKPDVIQIEHPWLFPALKKYASALVPSTKLVYSSHNIEWHLKKSILSSVYDKVTTEIYTELIKKIEQESISGSDATICVSENDANWLNSQKSKQTIIAPNGVKEWVASESGKKEAANITKGAPYALYCASLHPPNISGFFSIFGDGFGSLRPYEKLVIAGRAGLSIVNDARIFKSANLADRVVAAGVVSKPCLEGLLDGAHCIVLPITQGGGTNLKTAEAILSGKYIVATDIAMRGFERFIGHQGIFIENDPGGFKRALRFVMNEKKLNLTEEEKNFRQSVKWDKCLAPIITFMNEIKLEESF